MARAESKMIMGYLPIEPPHHAAILSLVMPATSAVKILDPFAGEGAFLQVAAQAWNVTPYANELDGERAAQCIERFGPTQAVRCDVERLLASNNAFGLLWANPPYDYDKTARASKRVEFAYLRHSWKWAQDGAVVMWCIYIQHLTEEAMAFLAKNSCRVDVWALPGKHQGEYDQIVVVAIKGTPPNVEVLYQSTLDGKANPRLLIVQDEPIYKLPAPSLIARFVFAPDIVDEVQGLRLIQEQGAWKTHGFQALLEVPCPPAQIEPVVAPRPGHLALVLAAGVANGAVIETSDYGQVALRGKTQHVEQITRVEVEAAPGDPERQVKKTTKRLKPTTTLTLLAQDGTVVEMEGDDALLGFITANKQALAAYLNDRFSPMYRFDFAGIGRFLDRIKLNGKYPLYTAQKHVIAAIVRGFQQRDSILLVGQMGTGKTAMGGTAAIAMASGVVKKLQGTFRNDQVVLVVAPPHLIEKWHRELRSISPNSYIARINRHEDVKAFMQQAARLGSGIAKIGLIKRDMTKLGAGREAAVAWRNVPVALWHHNQPTPQGYETHQRIRQDRVPICPHCGCTVMQERKGVETPATESWIRGGARTCSACHSPLWQQARDRGSQPKPSQSFITQNPRYRLDEYLKQVYPDRVFLLVWDEVHEAQHGDTGNGEAFGRMAGIAQKVLAMTGTPFNGRASSLFNLEYHLNQRVRQRYPWGGAARLSRKAHGSKGFQSVADENTRQRGRAESRWVADMGVREMVVEEHPSYDRNTGVFTGTSTYERPYEEAPGISPMLIAEVLDHAIFFSLGDLGKGLPIFEEIAIPVEMDAEIYAEYEQIRQQLKDYLAKRRWEGDTTFRGAYLQWAMGWPNAAHRPHEIIHNLKHPITGEKLAHVVASIPSYGEDRVYAKEQALIDLVQAELTANRPVVIYLRQTSTRDIQPRIAALIEKHVLLARPFILKNTVEAQRREAVIEAEVTKGTNVIIANPELVKTGLDLVFAPTLIFFELVFNLSTLMQAAARSYRLNQTHPHCKVYYLYAEGTMEQTAVQLMSRKQRAAKLLTGDIGLTGLDALTEGESGFEEALLAAIGHDESLINPSELFKASSEPQELDHEDAAYWNVVVEHSSQLDEVLLPISVGPELAQVLPLQASVIEALAESPLLVVASARLDTQTLVHYLDSVHLIADNHKRGTLQAQLLQALIDGVQEAQDKPILGIRDTDFAKSPTHTATLIDWVYSWLKAHRFVFAGCEAEVATQIVNLAKQNLPESQTALPPKPVNSTTKRPKTINLLTVPDVSDTQLNTSPHLVEPAKRKRQVVHNEATPQQLALF